jgi:hypothetical protein
MKNLKGETEKFLKKEKECKKLSKENESFLILRNRARKIYSKNLV